MTNCKQCGKVLVVTEGRRKKEYCDKVCKSTFWGKNRKKEGKYVLRDTFKALQDELEALKVENKQLKAKGVGVTINDLNKPSLNIKPKEQPKTNYTINTKNEEKPPMPTRMEGEDSFDFAARKNEWKLKYGI